MEQNTFQIEVADHLVKIISRYPDIIRLCQAYIREGGEAECVIQVTEKEIQREQTVGKPGFSSGYLETLAIYRKLASWMMEHDTVLFHGSAVAVEGKAYLFTAPSGTGKSTHTRLWRERFGTKAVMINDDKPFLKIEKDKVTVFGTPWNGKHGLGTNMAVPLQGICVLRQGKTNSIRRLTPREAFPELLQQIYRPYEEPEKMKRLLLLTNLLLKIPIWQMDCTISEEAVSLSYETMKGEIK